jgi:hypothetical protein
LEKPLAPENETKKESRSGCDEEGFGGMEADVGFEVGVDFASFEAGVLQLFAGHLPE